MVCPANEMSRTFSLHGSKVCNDFLNHVAANNRGQIKTFRLDYTLTCDGCDRLLISRYISNGYM